jgi:hypothetical protein
LKATDLSMLSDAMNAASSTSFAINGLSIYGSLAPTRQSNGTCSEETSVADRSQGTDNRRGDAFFIMATSVSLHSGRAMLLDSVANLHARVSLRGLNVAERDGCSVHRIDPLCTAGRVRLESEETQRQTNPSPRPLKSATVNNKHNIINL